MSSAVADGLRLLARKLVDEGHPLQAIKALHALLSQSLMPADEASVRLQLGQLLSEHTRNGSDAKKQLQRAVRSSSPGEQATRRAHLCPQTPCAPSVRRARALLSLSRWTRGRLQKRTAPLHPTKHTNKHIH